MTGAKSLCLVMRFVLKTSCPKRYSGELNFRLLHGLLLGSEMTRGSNEHEPCNSSAKSPYVTSLTANQNRWNHQGGVNGSLSSMRLPRLIGVAALPGETL